MVQVSFTPQLKRFHDCDSYDVRGGSVREALEIVFEAVPELRGYVLDDQGSLRQHVAIFINDRVIDDRKRLSDSLQPNDYVYVMQALSGG